MPVAALPFRQILCPVDFSPHSRSALRYAAAIAARSRGRLIVMFVNDPLLSAAAAASAYDTKALARDTEKQLRAFAARAIGQRRDVVFLTADGVPAKEIARAVDTQGVDLVVVGSRGLTGTSKLFFGSTTERLLRNTRVPVLIAPLGRRSKTADKAMTAWPSGHVLVPVDLDDLHESDVRARVALAAAFGARATLLYAVPPPQVPEWLRLQPRRRDAGRIQQAHEKLEALAGTVGADGCRVAFGTPADEIVAAAAETKASLVILNVARAAGLFGPRQGSTTYQIVSSDVAPILAIPSPVAKR